MKLIHPKKTLRGIANKFRKFVFCTQAYVNGIHLIMDDNVIIRDCKIERAGKYSGCTLRINNDAHLCGVIFSYFGDNANIIIGSGFINACKSMPVSFKCGANSKIEVKDELLFSNSIDLSTTDFHPVYDDNNKRINPNKSIIIGEHCWIGRNVYIGKGVRLASNTIVGAYSVVTRSFNDDNVMIAGNPASIKKEKIYWQ